MSIVRNYNLYLNAGRSIPLVINVNQYDQGEQWIFTLYNEDGTQYVPSTGGIVGIKSDGLGIINSGSVVDGKVVINETQQMTAAPGKAVYELILDNSTHGTANFVVLVEPKPGDNASLSESDLSLLQEAIDATSPLPVGGSVGQVLTKTANGSTWSDAGTPTQAQVAEAVADWADENITVTTGVVIDSSLSVQGAAADAKAAGDAISDLNSAIIEMGGGVTDGIKTALMQFTGAVLQLAEKVYVKDGNGAEYYADLDDANDALYDALYAGASLVSIDATYIQSGTVYDSATLDSLKSDLVVTALWSNGLTTNVPDSAYTLSGTLEEGTSTITVTYSGKTDTFSVTVTHNSIPSEYTEYDYLYYTGADSDGKAQAQVIKSKQFTDLNNSIIDFEFMPLIPKLTATTITGGSVKASGESGNGKTVTFFFRTDTKRVSCFSHGTALAMEGLSTVAVGSKTHVTLNPHASSPSTLTVGSDTYDGAWTDSQTVNSPIIMCGNQSTTSSTAALYGYVALGAVRVFDLSNNLLGELIPCVRNADDVIGIYDTVEGAFHTCSTESYATIGNSNCKYGVGDWDDVSTYTEYDYVYATDNNVICYVDTGLTHSPSWTTLNIEFEALNNNSKTSADALMGANNTNTSDTSNLIWYGRASKGGFSTYSLGVAKQLNTVPANTRAVCKYFFVDGGESYLQYDNTTVAVATVSASSITANNKTLLLAGSYQISDGAPYGMRSDRGCKLGYVKFTNPSTNALVYHFVPAVDDRTGWAGFYEKVNDVFYPSNAAGLSCGNWE